MNSSAKAPLCGYLYQIRYALLESIKKISCGEKYEVFIEKEDDVSFDDNDGVSSIQQVKHHKRDSTISSSSCDLWKTIRVWVSIINKRVHFRDVSFYLITTSSISYGTVPYYLRHDDCRDPDKALSEMIRTAEGSSSRENAQAYKDFMELDLNTKKDFIKRITIVSDNSDLLAIEKDIKSELYFACPRDNIDSFFQRLEGWWYSLVISKLMAESDSPIVSSDLDWKIESLSDQFKQDNLPVDYEFLTDNIDASLFGDNIFVKQLELIGVTRPARVFKAIRNYYFAFNQMTRWITEQMILNSELEKYENTLFDEWDTRFQIMLDEISEHDADEKMCQAAKKLYEWVETGDLAKIRYRVDEQNIARGTYQMLADKLSVGWHPQFLDRIKDLIGQLEM